MHFHRSSSLSVKDRVYQTSVDVHASNLRFEPQTSQKARHVLTGLLPHASDAWVLHVVKIDGGVPAVLAAPHVDLLGVRYVESGHVETGGEVSVEEGAAVGNDEIYAREVAVAGDVHQLLVVAGVHQQRASALVLLALDSSGRQRTVHKVHGSSKERDLTARHVGLFKPDS